MFSVIIQFIPITDLQNMVSANIEFPIKIILSVVKVLCMLDQYLLLPLRAIQALENIMCCSGSKGFKEVTDFLLTKDLEVFSYISGTLIILNKTK